MTNQNKEAVSVLDAGNQNQDRAVAASAQTQPQFAAVPVDLLQAIREYLDANSTDGGYGFYRPENPHDFHPDEECCSEEEIAAHKAACEAYDKGEYTPEKGSEWVGKTHILRAHWGIGGYTARDPYVSRMVAALDAILPSPQ